MPAGRGSNMYFGRRVSQTFVMQISRTWKRAALAGLLALALVGFAGPRSASAAPTATFDCTNGGAGPNLTLKIINNSSSYSIYPVVTAGARDDQPSLATGASQWMQACFRVSFNNLASQRYPRDSQYRFYVNCCGADENGIPPGGSVVITLPFYSPLVQNIIANPDTKNGIPAQFINWWQGGGINMFQALASDGKPPNYLTEFWTADQTRGGTQTPGALRYFILGVSSWVTRIGSARSATKATFLSSAVVTTDGQWLSSKSADVQPSISRFS